MDNELELIILSILGNSLIFIAYVGIPIALISILRHVKNIAGSTLFRWFAIFIFTCGITHAMDILAIWYTPYWLMSVIDLITGVVSFITLLKLIKVLKKVKELPEFHSMEKQYLDMQEELKRTRDQLLETRTKLEQINKLTDRL